MNPQDRDLLQKTYDLAKENNHILHGIRRSNRWSAVMRIVYWLLIAGISLGTFYYLQPYLDSVMKAYNNIQDVTHKIPGLN